MQISIIAAMTDQRVIGYHNQLPWQMPADLAHFKQITLHHPVIMGRKTYQSIGRPLPQRTNIIITRDEKFKADNCLVFHELPQAIQFLQQQAHQEIFIIGGAEIFTQALPLVHRLYLTLIHAEIAGDCYFPEWDKKIWREIQHDDRAPDAKNPYAYSFVTLQRQ